MGLDLEKTVLTFSDGKFQIRSASQNSSLRLSKDPYWIKTETGFQTTSLKAAAALRRCSDERAEKIFKRTFQEHYSLPELPPLSFLDPHQRKGVEWVLNRKRSYLAHAPGAGKTASAIVASCYTRGEGQTLFIVPPSLVRNWVIEIERFAELCGVWPSIGVVPRAARRDKMAWRADFIVCPDSMLAKSWVQMDLKRQWKFIAVDEASRFKEWEAERSLAFYGGSCDGKSYPGIFRDARHVVLLDGSPMPNRPIELWAPTYALHPEAVDCRPRDDFGYRYCGAKPNDRGQWEYLYSSNEAELKEKLRLDFMQVVGKEELSHPERLRSITFMSSDVRTPEHKSWEKANLSHINFGALSEDLSQGDLARFRRELGLRKVPWIASYVAEKLEKGNERILLFAWHRDVVTELTRRLDIYGAHAIMGNQTERAREAAMERFRDGRSKILVLNIAAGGRGHNLQAATRVIFGEYSWTDQTNQQCEDRTIRRGNDAFSVRCEYIAAPGSMDEPMLQSIFTKERRVKRIIG